MRISERQIGYVVAVALSGRLRGWKAARILDECLRRHAGVGIRMLVTDLAAVSVVDTVGLDAMIRGCQVLRDAGGEMRIVALTRRVHDLIAITRLVTLCDTFDTLADAIDGPIPAATGWGPYRLPAPAPAISRGA